MLFVAVETAGCVWITGCGEHAMAAALVVLDRFSVADAAVHRPDVRFAGALLGQRNVDMTLGTRRTGVFAEAIGRFVNVERDHLTVPFHRHIRIGVAAETVGVCGTARLERPWPDLVRLVALNAGRDLVRFELPESSLDDFDVHFFDARVALSACSGDVFAVNARPRVGVLEDIVRSVAGRTNRGNRQSFLIQANAVDRE
jgi:hypothetical protein